MLPVSFFLVLFVVRLFRGALLFSARGLRYLGSQDRHFWWSPSSTLCSLPLISAWLGHFGRWKVKRQIFFVARGFFLVAISAAFGVGKNRERDGGLNSSEGDGRHGGDAPRGDLSRSFSEFRSGLVGVREGGLGEEESTITSAELAIVASDAFQVRGQDSHVALEA
ncbi:hypothetical protein N7481_003991 [Penicillium waksmanii]|uniref:uncharacterized protein n=1 Tax=Penicillium waksmanii TaxID=69791 RepID=UPI0025494F37|nr:uncharacterized protein N7481_003991 [Penicillium waksmanii]KAJ5988781.1 hypothetical protein N7481_003991 [Penicillium waksmanii]